MSFVISKDNGEGNPPSFWGTTNIEANNYQWTTLPYARNYATEEEARGVMDKNDDFLGCIILPNDEVVFQGSRVKSVEVLSGTEPDLNPTNS